MLINSAPTELNSWLCHSHFVFARSLLWQPLSWICDHDVFYISYHLPISTVHQKTCRYSIWPISLVINSALYQRISPYSYDFWERPFIICSSGKQGKIAEYYEKQERLLEGFTEMEIMNEKSCLPGGLTEVCLCILGCSIFFCSFKDLKYLISFPGLPHVLKWLWLLDATDKI